MHQAMTKLRKENAKVLTVDGTSGLYAWRSAISRFQLVDSTLEDD